MLLDASILVSIVMSVYDGIKLDDMITAVDSILNQTFSDFEFIIVLDGVKRDDIRLHLDDLSSHEKRIKLIYVEENKGLANALNKAISQSVGEFIIRMDSDDISYPDRIKKLVNFMQANPELDVSGSFIEEFYESSPNKIMKIVKHPTEHDQIRKSFAKRNAIVHASAIFRRRFFEKAGLYPLFSIRNEDTLLFLSGFLNGCKFSNYPEVLYSVRFNDSTASRRIGLRKSFSDFVDRLRVIIDLKASSINIIYAFCLLIIQNMPYPIYNRIRSMLIYTK